MTRRVLLCCAVPYGYLYHDHPFRNVGQKVMIVTHRMFP